MSIQSRTFKIAKPALRRRYEISLNGGSPLVSVDVSDFTPGVPELTFKDGPDAKSSPVMGYCRMHKTSGDMEIGLVDPAMPQNEQWETLSKESLLGGEYRFSMTFPGEGRHTFAWKRTHSVGVGDSKVNPLSQRNFVLMDQQGAVVAVYTNDSVGLSTCGTLEIKADLGRQFDQMVIMTCVSIYDKSAKRRSGTGSVTSVTSVTAG